MKLFAAFILLFLLCGTSYAQKSKELNVKLSALYQEALTSSQQGNSLKSVRLLNDMLKMDSTFYLAYFALADLSHEAGKADEELVHLEKGLSFAGEAYPAGFKFLAEGYFRKGAYASALKNMEHYSGLKKSLNPEEQLLLASCRFSLNAVNHPAAIQLINPGDSINTVAEEYWPSLNAEANELVFTRLETKDSQGKSIAKPQEDFYCSKLDSDGWHKARPLGAPVNTDENEGAQTLSADGKWLIFSACGRADGLGSCDLYFSMKKNGKWSVPVNLGEPVNSGAWESQPSLSADGETLYFVSSRAGGRGKMDIWKAEKIGLSPEGVPQFGQVKNLQELNTAGNDLSPFIHSDGKTFYFASDGRAGLGGTDLFVSRLENGKFSEPVNLGSPINTSGNEEGLVVETSGARAWFSSDRNRKNGRDLFYFLLPDHLRPEPVSYLKGEVTDAATGIKISADIVLTNLGTSRIVRKIASIENNGEFLICLPSGINYGLSFSRKGYLFSSENVSLVNGFSQRRPMKLNIRLKSVTTGATTTLNNIFFETNSWQLKMESQSQLDQMAQFMHLNQGVVMEVVGHTDAVGTAQYNDELSLRRAEAVVEELLKRKIEPDRIKSRGAGFTAPVGDNKTEEGRRANRRTEFVIVEINKVQ